jgi:hypothetical protein
MVGYILMVLLGIMVSQSMYLLIGGVAHAGERLVESKVVGVGSIWRRVVAWRQGWVALGVRRSWLLHICGRWWWIRPPEGRVALAPDPTLKRLSGLLRLIFLIELDPVLRS